MATAPQPSRLMDIINSIGRGVPQAATGFVDLAALPFTMSGLLSPKQVVGSTEYLTAKGLLPPPSQSLLGQSVEAISGGLMPLSPAAMRATQAGVEATGRALAPKAGQMAEDYLRSIGGIADIVPEGRKQALQESFNQIAGGEKPVRSAVVLIGDKIFTGNTHTQAFEKAIQEGVVRKEGSKFIYPKGAEINSDLFMLNDGRIVDRLEASKLLDIGASETALRENKMQIRPANSMSIDEYMRQAEEIKKARSSTEGLLD